MRSVERIKRGAAMKYFLIAAIVTVLAAVVLVPLGYLERGTLAFGGEWVAVIGIGYVAFMVAYQNWIRCV